MKRAKIREILNSFVDMSQYDIKFSSTGIWLISKAGHGAYWYRHETLKDMQPG